MIALTVLLRHDVPAVALVVAGVLALIGVGSLCSAAVGLIRMFTGGAR